MLQRRRRRLLDRKPLERRALQQTGVCVHCLCPSCNPPVHATPMRTHAHTHMRTHARLLAPQDNVITLRCKRYAYDPNGKKVLRQ